MSNLIYLAPVLGVVALLFAFVLAGKVNAMDEGTDRMKEIAGSIREGANAFLSAEYKILVIFAAVLFVAIGFGVNWPTAICFVVGAIFSTVLRTTDMAWPLPQSMLSEEGGVCDASLASLLRLSYAAFKVSTSFSLSHGLTMKSNAPRFIPSSASARFRVRDSRMKAMSSYATVRAKSNISLIERL